jgi:lysophospholipase L1-like esterase
MLSAYKTALGPLLLLQARAVRKTALRLPEAAGPRSGTAGGAATLPPVRALFVGDSSAAGVGVAHQDDALAARAAALLSLRIGAPVEWQLVAKSGINTREALELVSASELKPADLLVTALGVNDVTSQRQSKRFIADYQALLEHVVRSVGARAIVISGMPPFHALAIMPQPLRWYLGQYARRLDASLRQWVGEGVGERVGAGVNERVKAGVNARVKAGAGEIDHGENRQRREPGVRCTYVSMQWAATAGEMASDGYHPGASQYLRWAQLVAESAAGLLTARLP